MAIFNKLRNKSILLTDAHKAVTFFYSTETNKINKKIKIIYQ